LKRKQFWRSRKQSIGSRRGSSWRNQAVNFSILEGRVCFGVFVDTPEKVTFDVGYERYDWMNIEPESDDFDLYLIVADTPDEVVTSFRRLIGRSYIPPKWAFGYGRADGVT
jgi:alpha-glucosidase